MSDSSLPAFLAYHFFPFIDAHIPQEHMQMNTLWAARFTFFSKLLRDAGIDMHCGMECYILDPVTLGGAYGVRAVSNFCSTRHAFRSFLRLPECSSFRFHSPTETRR